YVSYRYSLTTDIHTLSLHDALPIFISQHYPKSKLKKLSNCKETFEYFKGNPEAKLTDIAIVDYNIPSYESENINNGIDITRFIRSEEHTSELQSRENLVCRLLLEKK